MITQKRDFATIRHPHKNTVLDTKISNIFSTRFHKIFHRFCTDEIRHKKDTDFVFV